MYIFAKINHMKKLLSKLDPVKWKSKPSGMCPVQAEGYFLGYYFYFRGRWDKLEIEFAKNHDDWWDYKIVKGIILKETDMYEAGYYPYNLCRLLIYKGCFLFFLNRIFKWKL